MADTVLDRVREQYPELAWLFNDPEVGALLRDAVDPNKGFSPTTFQTKLYATNWFKRQSQSARQWNILKNTDPGEANARRAEYTTEIGRLASSLGIKLTPGQTSLTAEAALQFGWDLGGGQLLEAITAHGRKIGYGPGAIASNASKAKALSFGQYYLPMTNTEANTWGDLIVRGMRTDADLQTELQNRAISRYHYLAPELSSGKTMEDIFAGHRATIAQELEISPTSIDFTKGQWAKVLGIVDRSGTGKMRPLSLSETQTLARQDTRWWSTANGREADAGMANFMLKTFGKRA